MIKVKYNGTVLNDTFWVSNISRPSAPFDVETSKVQGMDGTVLDSLTYGERKCSFMLTLYDGSDRSLQDARRELMKLFAVRKPKWLTFSDERDPDGKQLRRLAVPDGTFDYDGFKRLGEWKVSMTQPDPYLYGDKADPNLKANRAKTINLKGEEVYPTIEMFPKSGRTAAIEFEDVNGGRKVTVIPNTTFRNPVEIDMEKLSVSAKDAVTLGTSSVMFPLTDGMKVRCNVDATMHWRERYL